MIVVFGSINIDLVSSVPNIAKPGETVLSPDYEILFGGKGANQAAAAARASTANKMQVIMAGAVGKDAFGDKCVKNLAQSGVFTHEIQETDKSTGTAFISVDRHAENAITVASGANMLLQASKISQQTIASTQAAILQMEVPLEENVKLCQRLKAYAVPVIFNFAPAIENTDRAMLDEMLNMTDYLIVNEHEAKIITSIVCQDNLCDPATIATKYVLYFIITLGAAGVEILMPNGKKEHVPSGKVDVVDTTGAGDTFVGTLAVALTGNNTIVEAAHYAAQAASQACTWKGAQPK